MHTNASFASHFHDARRASPSPRMSTVGYSLRHSQPRFHYKDGCGCGLCRLRDELSPLGRRLDVKAEVTTGFPYSLEHASRLAEFLAALIQELLPKKGLITDLDDTLWAGILGEIGVDGIAWDMADHAHMHGLYQQFLSSTSECRCVPRGREQK